MSWSKISDLEICGGRLQRLSNAIVFREKETIQVHWSNLRKKKLLMVHGADDPPDSSSDS